MTSSAASDGDADSFDLIASDLLALKDRTGRSYAEIGRRIGELRIERGTAPSAAFPARSTIYDAFRTGRTWIDPVLLRDIVRALGVDDAGADAWVDRSSAVRRRGERGPRRRTTRSDPAPVPDPLPITTPPPASAEAAARRGSLGWITTFLLVGGVALNLLGIVVVQALHLPIYLDMTGTAVVATVLGPWSGAAVAVASNLLGFTVGAPGAAPFALVNLAGALVWGYGVRRFRMGDDIVRFFNLNLLAAVACSLVGAPLGILLFGGFSGHGSDTVTSSFEMMGIPVLAAAFSANILTSVIDKLLTGFLALMIFVWLHRTLRVSASHMPLVEWLSALPGTRSETAAAGPVDPRTGTASRRRGPTSRAAIASAETAPVASPPHGRSGRAAR